MFTRTALYANDAGRKVSVPLLEGRDAPEVYRTKDGTALELRMVFTPPAKEPHRCVDCGETDETCICPPEDALPCRRCDERDCVCPRQFGWRDAA